MSGTHWQMYVHAVWATWDRVPLLDADLRPAVHAAIAERARALGCHTVVVGGIADHVHMLAGVPPRLPVARLVGACKGASSHLVNHRIRPGSGFRWRGGYGAFGVAAADVEWVRAYVQEQERRHRQCAVEDRYEAEDQHGGGDHAGGGSEEPPA